MHPRPRAGRGRRQPRRHIRSRTIPLGRTAGRSSAGPHRRPRCKRALHPLAPGEREARSASGAPPRSSLLALGGLQQSFIPSHLASLTPALSSSTPRSATRKRRRKRPEQKQQVTGNNHSSLLAPPSYLQGTTAPSSLLLRSSFRFQAARSATTDEKKQETRNFREQKCI